MQDILINTRVVFTYKYASRDIQNTIVVWGPGHTEVVVNLLSTPERSCPGHTVVVVNSLTTPVRSYTASPHMKHGAILTLLWVSGAQQVNTNTGTPNCNTGRRATNAIAAVHGVPGRLVRDADTGNAGTRSTHVPASSSGRRSAGGGSPGFFHG